MAAQGVALSRRRDPSREGLLRFAGLLMWPVGVRPFGRRWQGNYIFGRKGIIPAGVAKSPCRLLVTALVFRLLII